MLHVSRDICTCKQQRAKIMPYQHERHTQTCCMPCVSQASASNPPMKGCVSFSTHAFAWGSIVFEHVTCHLRLKPIQAVAWSVSNCLLQPRRHMHTSWMSYACSVHVNNCMPKPCLSKRWHHMQEYSISSPPRAQGRTHVHGRLMDLLTRASYVNMLHGVHVPCQVYVSICMSRTIA